MNRLDFLKGRQRGIGGSDIPTLLGLRPGANALDVYHSKTRPIDESSSLSGIDIERGNALEDQAREFYWRHTGRKGRNVKKPIGHPDYPAFKCHLDFEIFADDNRPAELRGPGIGETKCPRAFVMRKIADHGMRRSELLQGLTYAAVSRRSWAGFNYFSWEYDGGPTLPIDVPANTRLGKFLLETGQRFWDDHVAKRVPPDPDEWNLLGKDVAADVDEHAVRQSTGKLVPIDDEEFASVADQMMELGDLKKQAEAGYKAAGEDLQRWIEENVDSDRIIVPGVGKVTVVRSEGRSSFSVSAIEGHRPIDRDKLYKWLLETGTPTDKVEELLAGLELDIGQYRRQGEPYSYVRVTRAK
jgi:predicted phage-related endonuclease